jgi:hypothetical protein
MKIPYCQGEANIGDTIRMNGVGIGTTVGLGTIIGLGLVAPSASVFEYVATFPSTAS